MHDSKTSECSNSSQKVWFLLKKLGEISKSLSYREKFIQGMKFIRTRCWVSEYSSFIESQLCSIAFILPFYIKSFSVSRRHFFDTTFYDDIMRPLISAAPVKDLNVTTRLFKLLCIVYYKLNIYNFFCWKVF